MLSALIMAGGKGTRFWPLSTEEKPKQFLSLIGEDTMIRMTVERIKPIIPIERIFICTGEKYVELVKEQLPEIPLENIIVEPEGRNTAPCIALSALIMKRRFNDVNMLVLPSDHLIRKEEKFREIVLEGNNYILEHKNAIITLGIKPNRPETGYGYIKFNKHDIENKNIIKVEKFVEKPNLELAEKYILDGSYLWNGGMFLWEANNIINQIKKFAPSIYYALKDIEHVDNRILQKVIDKNYKNTEAISIDYAVLEKSEDIFVIPSDIEWDDIGTWKSVERYKPKDMDNNIINGNVRVIDSKSNIAINSNKKIVMIGIEDIMTLETEDTIFIVNKEHMDNLKDYKEIL
ncbi:TPA: mannose-1-phosphate guanylyltransferase [Clostridium perfringens]|nr:mannose-1-phosphate guanylyltransferase [Clostridium perfringens]HAT4284821.1 mannose-1-phosphate guanylyltransferase [Clostridium perfringens]